MKTRPATLQCPGKNEDVVLETLAKSEICRKFQRDFTIATGLPLSLSPVSAREIPFQRQRNENGFCASIAQRNSACSACLRLQEQLLERATHRACTLVCPFGMVESAVPVRSGGRLLGFLRTGQIFLKPPEPGRFRDVVKRLVADGTSVTSPLERAYLETAVIESRRYRAMMGMLVSFAGQLANAGTQIMIEQGNREPVIILKAKAYIRQHFAEELSLNQVARAVNTSPSYLCRLFRKTTGINFNHYRTWVRLESAKERLLNPNLRVGEIAYEAGFQSVTHFNRTFKEFMGQSPTAYRAGHRGV